MNSGSSDLGRFLSPHSFASLTRFFLKVDLAGFAVKDSFLHVSPNIKNKQILKDILLNLIEEPKVENLGQLFNLTGLTLRGLRAVTGLTEDEIIGTFVFKKGISFIDPSSTEARLIALGEV